MKELKKSKFRCTDNNGYWFTLTIGKIYEGTVFYDENKKPKYHVEVLGDTNEKVIYPLRSHFKAV